MSRVQTADAFDALADLEPESIHAVVTDPPYGLAFMGRDWDDFEPREYQEWCEEWSTLALEVLKPGGHLLAFSGNRTHHRLFTGVEDAGFEVRDTLTWHYGSGFPKALDVSVALDKQAGVEPDSVEPADDHGMWADDGEWNDCYNRLNYGAPTTEAAKEWAGWKTTLKPATEFIVLARKPLGEPTVAENVQAHGTGALNVDGCRVGSEQRENTVDDKRDGLVGGRYNEPARTEIVNGRYPANVIFDGGVARQLDRQADETSSNVKKGHGGWDTSTVYNDTKRTPKDGVGYDRGFSDAGGPSRYFYTSKASKAERTLNGRIENDHPTVKPVDLMKWLIRLVTRDGQTVLDPFAGTGTTGRAAKDLGREFVLIERNAKWADVARARCGLTPEDSGLLTENGQSTLPKTVEELGGWP